MNHQIKSVIIAKNRDYLLGYLSGCIDTKKQYNIVPPQDDPLFDNNVIEDQHPTLSNDTILDLHCSCGNYIAFKKWEEIPDNHLPCGLCDGFFVFYTDIAEKCALGGNNETKEKENKKDC